MLVTIGVLAHNESETIGRTVRSLFEQSVFRVSDRAGQGYRWELVVVPNGCKDDTHGRAVDALTNCCAALLPSVPVSFKVVSLSRPGKSHAWNKLIHEIASPATDVFVMIDADIEFGHVDTLANSVGQLLRDEHASIVVDLPLKHFARKARPNLLERASLAASRKRLAQPPAVAGSFYCAHARTLRSIWMPIDMSVEDGFLAAMVVTDCFRTAPDYSRIVRAPDATHYFAGLTDPRAIVNHEVRMVIGTLLNCYLCWDFLTFATPRTGPGAGTLIRDLNETDPTWYARMMANQIRVRGWRVISAGMVFRRVQDWRRQTGWRRWRDLPHSLVGFLFDLVVFWRANRLLVSGKAIGYW